MPNWWDDPLYAAPARLPDLRNSPPAAGDPAAVSPSATPPLGPGLAPLPLDRLRQLTASLPDPPRLPKPTRQETGGFFQTALDTASALGSGAARGAAGLGPALYSLADIATGGYLDRGRRSLQAGLQNIAADATGDENLRVRPEDITPFAAGTQQAQAAISSPLETDRVQRQRAEMGQRALDWSYVKDVATDPVNMAGMIGESLPYMLGITAPAGAARAAALARGASAERAAKIGERVAIGMNAPISGGTSALGAQEQIHAMPADQLAAQFPDYAALRQQGVSDADARARIAQTAGSKTAAVSGSLGTLASILTKGGAEGALMRALGGEGSRSIVSGLLKGALGEGAEEYLQSGGEKIGENVGMDQPMMRGVAESAALGGLLGLATGGAFGAGGQRIANAQSDRAATADAADTLAHSEGFRNNLLNANDEDLTQTLDAFDRAEQRGKLTDVAKNQVVIARQEIQAEQARRLTRSAITPTGEPGLPGSFDPSLGLGLAPAMADSASEAQPLAELGDWQRAGIQRELGRIDEEAVRRAETARLARAAQEPRTVPLGSSPAAAGLADIRPPSLDQPVLEGELLPPETMPRPVRRAALADEVSALNRSPGQISARSPLLAGPDASVGPAPPSGPPGLPAPALDWADLAVLEDLGISAPLPVPVAPDNAIRPERGQAIGRTPPTGRSAERTTADAEDRARLAEMMGPRPSPPSPPLLPQGQEPLAPRPDEGRTAHPAIRGGRLAFPAETGTLGIPNAEMPQIAAADRGALVNFLKARGIGHVTAEISPSLLRPSQAEFDPEKVAQAQEAKGGDRSILASGDGRVLDGHHQWLAALQNGEPVKVMRLDAPIDRLFDVVRRFPSATRNEPGQPLAPPPGEEAAVLPPQPEIVNDRPRPQARQNALQTQTEGQGQGQVQAEPQGQRQGEIQALLDRGGASLAPAPADTEATSAEPSPQRRYSIRPTGYPDGSWHVVGQNGAIWRFGTPEGKPAKRFKTERAAMAAAGKLNARPAASSELAPGRSAVTAKPLPVAARWNRAAPAEREALLKSAAAPSMAEARAKWSDIPEGAAKRRLRAAIQRENPAVNAREVVAGGSTPYRGRPAGLSETSIPQPLQGAVRDSEGQPLAPDAGRSRPAPADLRFSRPSPTLGQTPGLFERRPVAITELTGEEFGSNLDKKALARAADALLRKLQAGPPLANDDTGWHLVVGKQDRKKMGDNSDLSAASSKTVAKLADVVRQAVLADTHPDVEHRNPEVSAIHRLYAPARINGALYRVKLTVKDYSESYGRRNLHALEAVEIESALSPGTVPAPTPDKRVRQQAQPTTTEREISIPQLLQGAIRDSDGQPFAPDVRKSTAGQRATPGEEGVAQTPETFGGRSKLSVPQAADSSGSKRTTEAISVDPDAVPVDARNIGALREWLLSQADFKTPVVNRDTGRSIGFTRGNLKDSLKRKGEAQRKAYGGLRQLLESALFDTREPSDRAHLAGQDVYYAAMRLGEATYAITIKVDVARAAHTSTYKDHKAIEIEVTPAVNKAQADERTTFGYRDNSRPTRSGAGFTLRDLKDRFNSPTAPRPSRGDSAGNLPLTPAQARAQLADALGERHIEALEQSGRLIIHRDDPTRTGAAGFVDRDGVIHLVAPNLENGDALSVALHEALHVAKDERFTEGDRAKIRIAHAALRLFGLKNFIGNPGFTDLARQVRRLAAQGDQTALDAIAKARREDPNNADEESVAYLSQYADINKPLVQRVLAAIRAALYRMGLKVQLTADDVRALALSALKNQARAAAKKTRTARARGAQPAFSRLDDPLRQARNFSEARETAKAFLGKPLTSQDGLIASLSRNNIDKMLSASAARKSVSVREHVLAVANLDLLFSRSLEGWAKTDKHQDPNVKAIHRLFAPMVVGDQARLVKITVKEFSIPEQGNRIYSVEALEVTDESPVPEMVDADRADGSRLLTGPTGHVETLIQRIRDFNSGTAYSLPATEDDAAEQARLWEEFQQIRSQFKEREARATAFERWFGEGTEGITARDGKALVLYHGTPTEFYRFDAGRSGINSQHPTSGLGFFMTADRGAAARYGSNVLELHAKIDKPYFLTDADLMAVDSVETAVKFKRRLQEKGHDGAVVSGPGMAPYVIAFESRQVKLASNQNPTDSPDFRFSRSAMKSVEANIRRGLDALTKALLDKTSVHRAMYRQGLGWVDFVWGSEGRVTPSGKTKGAMGIAHILEARQRKDGMSRAEAEKLAYDLIEVIARGSEIRRYTFADTANVTLELGHHEAVLTKTQGSNAWVLSGWEVKPGATGVGNGTPRATLNASTPTQGDQGAGNTQSLSPSDPNRYSRPGRPVGPAELPAETKAQAFQRAVQDKFVRFQVVQDWVKKSGINLTPSADVYGAEALAPKKTAAETETAREKILKPLIARAAKNGWALSGGDLLAAIEDGQPLPATFKPSVGEYLHAAHAKERNAAIAKINPQYRDGGSGLTDAQADAILARYRGVRGFSLFERLAADFRGITDLTRSKLLGAGIISKETADAWRTAYSRYVPLKGGPEGSAQPSGTGPGISVAGRQRRALGHALRDENIVENIWRDHERAIALGHKQEVARALREFLRQANHSRIGTEGQPEKRAVLAQGWVHQVWIEGSPLGAFQSYNEARAAMAQDSLDTGRALSKYAVRHQMADQSVVYMGRPMLADNEVALYEDGQLVRLQLNDELLARAARNLGVDAANGLLKMGQSFNRWLSGAYTGYNPEFILTNVARDMTAGTINLTGKYGIKTAGRALAAYPGAVKALWRYIRTGHDPLVERYRAAGGSTGAAYLSDLERIGSDIKRVFQDLQGARETWAGGDRAGAVRVAVADKIRVVGRRIENLNKIGENALRVATFKTLLDAGKSEVEAARAAGEVTVNFNRKGELTAQLGGLYLFFNPSVQGTKIMWDALFKGPHRRQAQALAGGLALLAFSIAQSARGGSDDDEKRWQRIQSYTKDRNLVIPIGQELLTIPVPYGYGAFWSLGNILSDLMSGEDGVKAGIRLASTVFEQFSPIGNPFAGDEASVENLLTFLPTAIKPAMSVAMNRTELGRPVMPEVKAWEPGQPDSRRMWRSTQGTMWERAAEAMNRWSGGDRYQGGLVDVSPETLKLIWTTFAGGAGQFATDAANLPIMMYQGAGETIEPREIPILRRFFKTATIQDARAVFNAQAGAIQEALATFNAARRDRNFEAARDIQSEHRELLALGRTLRSAQQAVRARRQMEDEIGRSDLPLAEKRRQLDALEQKEEAIYSKFHDLFLAAKRREAA